MRKQRQESGEGNKRDLLREAAKHIMQDFVSKAVPLVMTASVPRAQGTAKQKSAMTNMGVWNADRNRYIHIHTQRSWRDRETFRICFGGRTEGIY